VQFVVYTDIEHVNICSLVTLKKQVSDVASLPRNTSWGTESFVAFAVSTMSNEPWHAAENTRQTTVQQLDPVSSAVRSRHSTLQSTFQECRKRCFYNSNGLSRAVAEVAL